MTSDNDRPNVFVNTNFSGVELEDTSPEVQEAWEKAVIEHTIRTLEGMGFNVFDGDESDKNLFERGNSVRWDEDAQEVAKSVLEDAICGGVVVPGMHEETED
jgi:hypothetical protein